MMSPTADKIPETQLDVWVSWTRGSAGRVGQLDEWVSATTGIVRVVFVSYSAKPG